MAITPYELQVGSEETSFEFISEGPKGKITKLVVFQLIQVSQQFSVFNLAFGDKEEGKENLNDLIVTDNDDTEKVLATVVAAVILFLHFKRREKVVLYAVGSTKSRTRLYQMAIGKYYNYNNSDLEVLGQTDEENWEPFRKGVAYKAFILNRKNYI